MKLGDMVKLKSDKKSQLAIGVTVDFIKKKCFRTHELGRNVNWDLVDPEMHAVILVKGSTITIPVVDLEVLVASDENR